MGLTKNIWHLKLLYFAWKRSLITNLIHLSAQHVLQQHHLLKKNYSQSFYCLENLLGSVIIINYLYNCVSNQVHKHLFNYKIC